MYGRITKWSITLAACAAMAVAGCSKSASSSTSSPNDSSSTTRASTQSSISGGRSESGFVRQVVQAESDWGRLNNAQKLAKIEATLFDTNYTSLPSADELRWAMERLLELAGNGYAGAQYRLGTMKISWQKLGLPDTTGSDSVRVLMQKAAAQNHPAARYQLARFYLADKKGPECIRQLEKSANSGYAPAMALLGFVHRAGAFGKPNPTAALAWAEKGAKAGDAESMVLAGKILQETRPTEKVARNSWYAKAAAKKHLEGLGQHAFAAWPTQGGGGNIAQAAARLRVAVDVGKKASMSSDPLRPDLFSPADSLFMIGMLVELIRRDKAAGARFTGADSLDLLKKAAKAGNSRAAAMLKQLGITP